MFRGVDEKGPVLRAAGLSGSLMLASGACHAQGKGRAPRGGGRNAGCGHSLPWTARGLGSRFGLERMGYLWAKVVFFGGSVHRGCRG